ncbi:MAG: CobW family GTP-binding protein, partial [Dolichospermum sp.]
ICCTINNDLVDAVYKVLAREEKLDYLVVETTGLADPLPVAMTFLASELRDLTRLDSIITVVDAANYSLDLFNSEAALSQITYGDVILLNKTDLVDETTLQELEKKINNIKEGSRIIRTTKSQVSLPLIMSVGLFESDKYFDDHTKEHDDHSHFEHEDHEHHNHDHSHHLENDGFTSISFQIDQPFSIRRFQYFLDNQLPTNVFRAKGIMWFQESPQRHIFHLCGKRFTIDDDQWKNENKKQNQLVLIGQNLDSETLLQQLENCLCVPSNSKGKGFGNQ